MVVKCYKFDPIEYRRQIRGGIKGRTIFVHADDSHAHKDGLEIFTEI